MGDVHCQDVWLVRNERGTSPTLSEPRSYSSLFSGRTGRPSGLGWLIQDGFLGEWARDQISVGGATSVWPERLPSCSQSPWGSTSYQHSRGRTIAT